MAPLVPSSVRRLPALARTPAPRCRTSKLDVPSRRLYLVPALHRDSLHRPSRPSSRLRTAPAGLCTAAPCLCRHRPPLSSHPTNTAATTSSRITCCPASTSAPPSPPRRHTAASSTPAVHAAAPAIVLASDRPSLSPPPWFRNYGRSSRRQSHNVEVYTVGRPRTTPEAARLAQAA